MNDAIYAAVSNVDLARWQFAATTVFHFLFVPVTIGLGFLTAVLQTRWHRSGDEDMLRATRFFGILLLINVAVGVVTGLVQEFQFGMNWSSYSRYVGDVFGAPLAMEGLIAFFLESTFLGVWLFGWNRIPKRLHLASIWLVAFGTLFSAVFIIAANTWMQHPVGYKIVNGRAELTNIWAVLGSSFFLWSLVHVILASIITGGMLMLAVSLWQLWRKSNVPVFRRTATIALIALAPASLLAIGVGSKLGSTMTAEQPMKTAAMEAQWTTDKPADFSLFQIGGWSANDKEPVFKIEIPHMLSILATETWSGEVKGMDQLQAQYTRQYGPGNYRPTVWIQYWSMRVMSGLATLVFLLSLWGLWLVRRGRLESSRWFPRVMIPAVVLPVVMNTAGWVLTENGRQPWIVQGLQKTADAVSPSVGTASIVISLVVFVLLYGTLALVDFGLMIKFGKRELPPTPDESEGGAAGAPITY